MIRFIAMLFSLATLGGVAAAGGIAMVFWMYGSDLPDTRQLASYEPATLSRVYSGEGRAIAEFAREKRIFAPIDEIPDVVKQAFISAENKNFYADPGVDGLGVLKALAEYAIAKAQGRDSQLRGASTITMQVVKNFLLDSTRELERKAKEMILAVRISQTLSKDRILELYLNEIYLGANSYGVAAAARAYFGKTLEELTLGEAAYLAALPKAPSRLHPVREKAASIGRRNFVLREMAENGYITQEEVAAARAEDLLTLLDGSVESQLPDLPQRSYFTEEIRRQLDRRLGREALFGGGLTIRATIDPELQSIAEKALKRRLLEWDRERGGYRGPLAKIEIADPADEEGWRDALAGADVPRDVDDWRPAVVLEVGQQSVRVGIQDWPEDEDGHYVSFKGLSQWAARGLRRSVRAPSDMWAVGDVIHVAPIMAEDGETLARFEMRQVPEINGGFMAMDPHTGRVLAMQGGFDFNASVFNRATQATRQPGSAFKPFVYAAALDLGYTPASVVLDAPVVVDQGNGRLWKPKNSSNRFYGPTPLRVGLERSRNLMTVRIAQDVGMDIVADYAERFGVYEDMPHHLAYSLGAGETTLYQMVAAYAMFANGGRKVEPTLIDRIQDRRGETIYRHDQRACPDCARPFDPGQAEPWARPTNERIMDPVTAFQLTSMMEGVTSRGTASFMGDLPFPVAGKTGTTNESKDAWFVGYAPNLVAGCFIGYDNPRPMGRGAYGGTLCGPVFKEFMAEVFRTRPAGRFERPDDIFVASVDLASGVRVESGGITEYFRAGTEPALYENGGYIGSFADSFFGGGGDLLIGSGDGSLSLGGGSGAFEIQTGVVSSESAPSAAGGEGAAQAPAPPRPSVVTGDIGLGSGGLY